MTLPISGPLNLSAIGTEAKLPLLSPVAFNSSDLRNLANKLTVGSQISVNDFYGKTYGVGPGYGSAQFNNVTGVGLNIFVTSNTIYLNDAPAGGVSMALQTNSAEAYYSINGGAYVSSTVLATVKMSDSVTIKIKSSGSWNSQVTSQIVYGGTTKSMAVSTAVAASTVYILCQAQYNSGGRHYRWSTNSGGGLAENYKGKYTTFGSWMANPTLVYNDIERVFWWEFEVAPGDVFYVRVSTDSDGPFTAEMDSWRTSTNNTQPGIYMGQTGLTAYASYSQGFKLAWKGS